MSLLGTKAGDAYLLGQIAGVTTDTKLVLHLSTNARAPTYDDTVASWTEASGSGYVTVDLLWSAVTITTADPFSYFQWGVYNYAFTGSIDVTGYFITDPAGAVVVMPRRSRRPGRSAVPAALQHCKPPSACSKECSESVDVPYRVVEVCWVLPRSHVYYTCRRLVRRGRPSRLALSSFGDGKLQVENVSLSQIAVAAANPGVSKAHEV